MSKFVVLNGTMTLAGTAFAGSQWDINSVSVDASVDIVNYPTMTEEWLEQFSTIKTSSFGWETAWDDTLGIDLANTIGETAMLFFDSVDGLRLSAQAIVESASISAPVDGVATVTWSGQSDGILIES